MNTDYSGMKNYESESKEIPAKKPSKPQMNNLFRNHDGFTAAITKTHEAQTNKLNEKLARGKVQPLNTESDPLLKAIERSAQAQRTQLAEKLKRGKQH